MLLGGDRVRSAVAGRRGVTRICRGQLRGEALLD